MALVAYDVSDSEQDSEMDEQTETQTSIASIFSFLPEPKKGIIDLPEEEIEDISKINNNNKPNVDISKKKPKKEPVKISIPSLKDYANEEEEIPKKIFRPKPKATGLFAILPAPKCVPEERSKKFDALVVKKKNLVPRAVKNNEKNEKLASKVQDNDSDDENLTGEHYFSSIFNTDSKVSTLTSKSDLKPERNFDCAKPVKDMNSKTNEYFSNLMTAVATKADESEEQENTTELDENALDELCGKRRKRQKQDIQIVDINAADIMPDSRDWMTKALTEEKQSSSKRTDEPSLQSRRKHQITYLAYQAKMNEQELKNQWAMNRISRKQTQAKYGF